MTTTKLGRQILGHHCTYSCDCDTEWIELDAESPAIDCVVCGRPQDPDMVRAFFAGEVDEVACPCGKGARMSRNRHVNPGSPSTFAAVVVTVAAGGLLAMGAAVVLLNWMGVL